MNLNRQILKDSAIVTFIGIISQSIGFLIPILVAMKFGANFVTDAYYLAVAFPVLLIGIIVGSSVRLVFIPVFVEERILRPESVNKIVGSVSVLLLGVSVLSMFAIALLMQLGVFNIFAAEETANIATTLTFEFLPIIPLRILYNLYVAVYQAHQRFVIPEITTTLHFILEICVILLLAESWGIHSIIVGQFVGQFVGLFTMIFVCKRTVGIKPVLAFAFPPAVVKMLKLSGYAIGAFILVQLNPFAARLMSGLFEEGGITVLSISQKFLLIPSLIIGGSISTVLTSHWSKQLTEKRFDELKNSFQYALSIILLIILPLAMGIIFMREILIRLIFERGEFNSIASARTAEVVGVLALTIIPTYIHMIVVRILQIQKKMRELFLISFLGMLINITLMYLISFKMGLGVSGIAWGIFLGQLFVMLSTAIVVQKYYSIFDFDALFKSTIKTIVGVILMTLIIALLSIIPFGESKIADAFYVLSSIIAGGFVYAVTLKKLAHKEFSKLLKHSLNVILSNRTAAKIFRKDTQH